MDLYTESVNIKLDKNNDLHVAWVEVYNREQRAYYTKLDEWGEPLIDDVLLFSQPLPRRPTCPDLGIDSYGEVHIVFEINTTLWYTKLDTNGEFIKDPMLLTDSGNSSTDADLLIDPENNIHVVWSDWRDGTHKVYYSKLDELGNPVISDTVLSRGHSYDPSMVRDSEGNLIVSWISKDHQDDSGNYTSGASLAYTVLDPGGEVLGYTGLDIFGTSTDHFSLEMCINPEDQLSFVWTKDNELSYFTLNDTYKFNKSMGDRRDEMVRLNRWTFFKHVEEVNPSGRYYVDINISKKQFGLTEGDIFLVNGDRQDKIGEWKFDRRYYLRTYSLKLDATGLIRGAGNYSVVFQKRTGFGNPKIFNVTLCSWKPYHWTTDFSFTLNEDESYEPGITLDEDDNIHIAWYNSTNSYGQIFYLRSDLQGRVSLGPQALTETKGAVYDPTLVIDNKERLIIVWFDSRHNGNGLYYMKLDKRIVKIVPDKRISNDRALELEMAALDRQMELEKNIEKERRQKTAVLISIAAAVVMAACVLVKHRNTVKEVIAKKRKR